MKKVNLIKNITCYDQFKGRWLCFGEDPTELENIEVFFFNVIDFWWSYITVFLCYMVTLLVYIDYIGYILSTQKSMKLSVYCIILVILKMLLLFFQLVIHIFCFLLPCFKGVKMKCKVILPWKWSVW